ncbi:MAG: 3'(2'),5'-bisphosphate nucleotidase CysQ [Leptolyngbya sp. BL-A-14]
MNHLQATELQELLTIARSIGWGAADILLNVQMADLAIQDAAGEPITAADTAVDAYILNNLHASLGSKEFAYLTEETYKTQPSHERLGKPLVWVIDPLDGTKDFIQGTGEYAVHIALLEGNRPVLAVVACPAAATLYFATAGNGTFVEKQHEPPVPIRVSQRSQVEALTIVASRSHRNERFNQLMQQFPVQKQRSVGSVGGKIAAILQQQADVYVSLSGRSAPKDWDLAAPELVLTEAGGRLTHFDGTPLRYNQEDVSQWGGLLASNGPCHEFLCAEATRILATIDAP